MRILLTLLTAAATLTAASAADLPFRPVTTKAELLSLPTNAIITTLDQLQFTTAATVSVDTATLGPLSATSRGNNSLVKVYKPVASTGTAPAAQEVPLPLPPMPNDPYDPDAVDLIFYETHHDAAQSWATMSETGAPFIFEYVDGQAHGKSTASWSTHYVVPGTGDRDVYVQFTIPPVSFDDRFLDRAISPSWARLRVEFLVDGYPAWSTETYQFNEFYSGPSGNTQERLRLDTFGYSIGLTSATPDTLSKTISLKLGTYAGGKALDFTLLFQGEAKALAGCGIDHEKQPNGSTVAITVCSGVSVRVAYEPNTPVPTFYSKPAAP